MGFKGSSFETLMAVKEKEALPIEEAAESKELMVSGQNGASAKESAPANMGAVLEKAMSLFMEQAQMGTNGSDVTLADIELSEAKATSFLNAINNALSMSHLANLVEAEKLQFKRTKEMEVYNPMLEAFAVASHAVGKKMHYVARQMNRTVDNLESYEAEGVFLDHLGSMDNLLAVKGKLKHEVGGDGFGQNWEPEGSEAADLGPREYVNVRGERKEFAPGRKPNELILHLDGLQYVFDRTLQNMSDITTSIDNLVKSERYSGAKPWGNSRAGIPTVTQPSRAGTIRRRIEAQQREVGRVGASRVDGEEREEIGATFEGTVVREMSFEELAELVESRDSVNKEDK